MNTALWKKLVGMAQRGDKVVVVEGGEAMVLLPLEAYESLQGGAPGDDDEEEFELPDLDDMMVEPKKEPAPIQRGSLDEFEEERFYLEPVE